MGSSSGLKVLALVVVALVLVGQQNGVSGQQLSDCIGKLLPCSGYLNSNAPPESCCNPLREAFQTHVSCLCGLYNSRETFKSFGINITQILQLPMHCGINYNLSVCNTNLAPASAPGPSSDDAMPPVMTSGSNMVSVGKAGLMGVLLLTISMTMYRL